MTVAAHTSESGRPASSKLGWLIAGRLMTAVVLTIVATFWIRAGEPQQSFQKSLLLLTIVACLTIAYAILFRFYKNIRMQARFQLALDVLLVTALVWDSNVIQSPYIALYILVIAISSLFLSQREVVVTSVSCAVLFTACSLALTGALGPDANSRLIGGSLSQTVQWIGLFDIAFFVVGLLSGRLADRQTRSDVRLQAARKSLASLRALHERIVASIRSGVVTTDLDGRIYTFNAAAHEITGYTEEAIRGHDASILLGHIKDHVVGALRPAEKGPHSPRFETSCLTSEGMRLR